MKTISTQMLTGAMLLGGALFASCQRAGVDASDLVNPLDARDGSFTIVGNLSDYQTRAHDAVWDAGDQIGVFAFNPGTADLFNNFANVQYNTVDAAGVFKAANGGIVLKGSEKADIAAYYPYTSALQGSTYAVNVADQSDLKKLDLLYGKGTLTADATTATVPVKFAHKLSLVQIQFTPKTGETLPATIKATLKGAKTAATFDVVSGALTLGTTTSDLTLTAQNGAINLILLPGDVLSGLEFDFDGKVVPFTFDAPYTLQEGKKYLLKFIPTTGETGVELVLDANSINDWDLEVTFETEVPYGDAVNPDPTDPGTPDPGTPDPEIPSTLSLAFPGADFETTPDFGQFGLKYSEVQDGVGMDGSKALYISGTPTKTQYVFSTPTTNAEAGKTYSTLTFWIKGTAVGKSLSVNVYNPGVDVYAPFNLGEVTGDVTVTPSATNGYNGNIDTAGKWVKITLDLTGLELNTSGSGNTFAFKINAGTYDLYLDNIELK